MISDIVIRSFVRFIKGFIAGGISAIAVIQPPLGSTKGDLILWLHALITAFGVGGILGIEKLLSQIYGDSKTLTTPIANQTTTTTVSNTSYVGTVESKAKGKK